MKVFFKHLKYNSEKSNLKIFIFTYMIQRNNDKTTRQKRDPRAIIMSRQKIAMMDGVWRRDAKAMVAQLKNECGFMVKNRALAAENPESVLIIRYEDMSTQFRLFTKIKKKIQILYSLMS